MVAAPEVALRCEAGAPHERAGCAQKVDTTEMFLRKLDDLVAAKVIPDPAAWRKGAGK